MESVNPTSMNRDLLGDLDEIVEMNYASKGQRFANYLIDNVIIYVMNLGISTAMALFLDLGRDTESISLGISFLLSYTGYVVYYVLTEGFLQGRTLGKLVTGTHAVGIDGQPLTFQQAFYRSLCRIVPFEPFSGLGAAPWHDSWTNTTVLKKKK